jgi:hypothetical protein
MKMVIHGTTYWAAGNGHLDCLQYAHENGCPWDVEATYAAARHGQLHCLQYAHENGCLWDNDTTHAAARGGHLNCLQYIYEECGDVVTWEVSNIEHWHMDYISVECIDYIESVREDWKAGLNRSSAILKPAKR